MKQSALETNVITSTSIIHNSPAFIIHLHLRICGFKKHYFVLIPILVSLRKVTMVTKAMLLFRCVC